MPGKKKPGRAGLLAYRGEYWLCRAANEALCTLELALRRERPGRFQIEAAIAAQHAIAASLGDTD